jgi:hypothetical protein
MPRCLCDCVVSLRFSMTCSAQERSSTQTRRRALRHLRSYAPSCSTLTIADRRAWSRRRADTLESEQRTASGRLQASAPKIDTFLIERSRSVPHPPPVRHRGRCSDAATRNSSRRTEFLHRNADTAAAGGALASIDCVNKLRLRHERDALQLENDSTPQKSAKRSAINPARSSNTTFSQINDTRVRYHQAWHRRIVKAFQ